MIVTINTDASFSKKHQVGSYAFWIVSNEFKILKFGVLKNRVERPEVAEFRCIINALHTLFKNDTRNISKIIVNTDCLNVIHLVKKNKQAIRLYRLASWGNPLMKSYEDLRKSTKSANIPIEFRHVKSHTGINDARSYVNEWCDKMAKEQICKKIKIIETRTQK